MRWTASKLSFCWCFSTSKCLRSMKTVSLGGRCLFGAPNCDRNPSANDKPPTGPGGGGSDPDFCIAVICKSTLNHLFMILRNSKEVGTQFIIKIFF